MECLIGGYARITLVSPTVMEVQVMSASSAGTAYDSARIIQAASTSTPTTSGVGATVLSTAAVAMALLLALVAARV
jgi:hypothetical protein